MKERILFQYYKLLGKLAAKFIKKHNPIVIGITGSIGKTSTRMIISKILETNLVDKKIYTSEKNFNGELGLSFSIFQIKDYSPTIIGLLKVLLIVVFKLFFAPKPYDIIFLEYGIDHIGEMDFLLSIVKPNYSVFTRIDKVHSSQFGTPDIIAKEKFKLINNTKEGVFLNINDEYVQSFKDNNELKIDIFYYSTIDDNLNQTSDISFENYDLINDNGQISSKFDMLIKSHKVSRVMTNLIGKENCGYVGIGYVLSKILKYRYNQIDLQLPDNIRIDFTLQPGRFNFLKGIQDTIIIDSTYNAAPNSMKKIIENVYTLKQKLFIDYKLILVLGDMRELGDFTEVEHRQVASLISQAADYVFCVGPNMSNFTKDELIKIGFDKNNIFSFLKSTLAGIEIKKFINNQNDRYVILFKGSQNTIFMEEAIKPILLNKDDEINLPRQSDWWIEKKNEFFNN